MFPFFLFLFSTECKCKRETAPWEEDDHDPPLFLPVVVVAREVHRGRGRDQRRREQRGLRAHHAERVASGRSTRRLRPRRRRQRVRRPRSTTDHDACDVVNEDDDDDGGDRDEDINKDAVDERRYGD